VRDDNPILEVKMEWLKRLLLRHKRRWDWSQLSKKEQKVFRFLDLDPESFERRESQRTKDKQMTEKEFNPATMITAGTLRGAGFPIPENIPDCAWTYREQLEVDCTDASCEGCAQEGIMRMDVSLKCGAFHWVEAKVTSIPMEVDCD